MEYLENIASGDYSIQELNEALKKIPLEKISKDFEYLFTSSYLGSVTVKYLAKKLLLRLESKDIASNLELIIEYANNSCFINFIEELTAKITSKDLADNLEIIIKEYGTYTGIDSFPSLNFRNNLVSKIKVEDLDLKRVFSLYQRDFKDLIFNVLISKFESKDLIPEFDFLMNFEDEEDDTLESTATELLLRIKYEDIAEKTQRYKEQLSEKDNIRISINVKQIFLKNEILKEIEELRKIDDSKKIEFDKQVKKIRKLLNNQFDEDQECQNLFMQAFLNIRIDKINSEKVDEILNLINND